jgi:hypothetical protein
VDAEVLVDERLLWIGERGFANAQDAVVFERQDRGDQAVVESRRRRAFQSRVSPLAQPRPPRLDLRTGRSSLVADLGLEAQASVPGMGMSKSDNEERE